MIPATIITFLKSKLGKATIIGLILLFIFSAFAITIAVKNRAIKRMDEQIKKQKENILHLKFSKETLENELNYIKNDKVLNDYYTNSNLSIEKIEREKLTRFDNEAINKISNDFYNFYDKYKLSNYRKVYKSSSVHSARKILYPANFRQARFIKSLSTVGN